MATAAARRHLRAHGGASDGRGHHDFDLRLHQRDDLSPARGSTTPWRWTACSSGRWRSSITAHHTPVVSLVVQCVWACLLTLTGTYSDLLDYVIFAVLLFYMLTIAGRFRAAPHAAGRWSGPYRALGYPVLPALYIAAGRADRSSAAALQAELHLARTDHRAVGGAGVLRVERSAGVTCGIQAKRLNHESADDEALEPHHGGVRGRRAHAEAHAGPGEPGGAGHRRHHRRGAVLADRHRGGGERRARPSRSPSWSPPSAARSRACATASSPP